MRRPHKGPGKEHKDPQIQWLLAEPEAKNDIQPISTFGHGGVSLREKDDKKKDDVIAKTKAFEHTVQQIRAQSTKLTVNLYFKCKVYVPRNEADTQSCCSV
jgi:hypothetical protein